MSVTDRPSLNGDASEPAPACDRTPKPAQSHTGPIRPCPECLRSTVVETVPAQSHTLNFKTITVPGYTCCSFCGWVHGYIEETA